MPFLELTSRKTMTIRNLHQSAQRRPVSVWVSAIALIGLTGCQTINNLMEPDRIDYKSAGSGPNVRLDIPPDLTQLQKENRYALPDNRGTATASGYNAQRTATTPTTTAVIAPRATAEARLERSGSQRWLVVKQTPEVLWPMVKDFWQDLGFLINIETPESGVMETDWAENRARIPMDPIRKLLGKYLDSVYDSGERDKFRTRLERGADGTTEIYISHRGATEVLTGVDKTSTMWTLKPSDPELEADFLGRLMVRLGTEEARAKAAVTNTQPMAARAKLVKGGEAPYVEVDEGFDRAWRRVGLALDRVGFTVEDRDRNQGLYFVRYVDQAADVQTKTAEPGIFAKLFSWGSKKEDPKTAQRYRILVRGSGAASQVAVLNNDGRPETSQVSDRILNLLNDQLK
jgi:outer membrane protein assembly factor BamC